MTMQSASSVGRHPVPDGGALLADPLLQLVHHLREAGVGVSSSEVIDATAALRVVDALDREQVRRALSATLIKRSEDRAAFEMLFELAFAIRRQTHDVAPVAPADEQRRITTSLDRVGIGDDEDARGAADLIELIMEAIRRGDPEALRALAAMAVDRYGGMDSQRDASERYFLYRVLRALELSRLMGEMLRAEVDESGRDESAVRAELAERIEAFKKLLASEVRSQLADSHGTDASARAVELMGTEELDFLGASPRQLAAMREAIRPLARALASKMARRRRRRDRGRLDVRRTVRRSLSSGGVLLDPAFRRPKVARPDLFVLCDVSGSVAEFASFTLTLLQAMTGEFPRMRSFAFVDGIDEVTDHLKDVASFLEVRHVIYRANVVREDGHSDYGAVLERFLERHGSAIDSRSTLIVTGDARSNYREPRIEALRALQTRARRVYLLNPEPEEEWDTTDSIVGGYRPALDGVFEVRNLRQLAEAIYRIT
jgi:uncharacterized protein with von Willebrand factor type A (vWA) domain